MNPLLLLGIENEYTERLPSSTLFWLCLGLAALLWTLGRLLWVGPLAGILGVWAISLFVVAIAGYGLFGLWHRLES